MYAKKLLYDYVGFKSVGAMIYVIHAECMYV